MYKDERSGARNKKPLKLPETNKMVGIPVSFWVSAYFQGQAVSFRECNSLTWWNHGCLHSPWNYQLDFPLKNNHLLPQKEWIIFQNWFSGFFFLAVSFREGRSWNILGSTHSLHEMTSHCIPTGMLWTSKSWQTIICRTWSSIHSQRLGTTLTFSEEWNFPFPSLR